MKRILTILLTVTMIISGTIVAKQEVAAKSECNHYYATPRKITTYYRNDGNKCTFVMETYNTCQLCGHRQIIEVRDQTSFNHKKGIYSASCDGRRQTFVYNCLNGCGYSVRESKVCPGGPHTGKCNYLPV